MKTETLMWLLPIVFMFHDFEEVIMFKPWLKANREQLERRFPKLAARLLPHMLGLSTSSFAVGVLIMFGLVSAATYVAAEFGLYALWLGVLMGFFIHLILHIAQFVVYRAYVPVIATSVLGSAYCVFAIVHMVNTGLVRAGDVASWTLVTVAVIVVSVPAAHALAARFQWFLRRQFGHQAND